MALQLDTVLSTGFTANYWRVTKVSVDRPANRMVVTALLYKDVAARTVHAAPCDQREYDLDGVTIQNLQDAADPIALTYSLLKALPEFAGAQDV